MEGGLEITEVLGFLLVASIFRFPDCLRGLVQLLPDVASPGPDQFILAKVWILFDLLQMAFDLFAELRVQPLHDVDESLLPLIERR